MCSCVAVVLSALRWDLPTRFGTRHAKNFLRTKTADRSSPSHDPTRTTIKRRVKNGDFPPFYPRIELLQPTTAVPAVAQEAGPHALATPQIARKCSTGVPLVHLTFCPCCSCSTWNRAKTLLQGGFSLGEEEQSKASSSQKCFFLFFFI